MDLLEAIRLRASVRSLMPVEVSDVDLEAVLDAGRRAPSGRNRQPIEFIVVREAETIRRLAEAQGCLGDVGLIVLVVGKPEVSAGTATVQRGTTKYTSALGKLAVACG